MKRILLLLFLFLSLGMQAAEEFWCMRTQGGELVRISDVSYLLTSSGAKDFTIVKSDNSQLQGITSVSFVKSTATGIASVAATPQEPALYAHEVGTDLTILGTATGQPVYIYNAGGRLVRTARTAADQTSIDVSSLAHGLYILRVGRSSVKFIKK
jgi:hypothetical protein